MWSCAEEREREAQAACAAAKQKNTHVDRSPNPRLPPSQAAITSAATAPEPYPTLLASVAADATTSALVTPSGLALDAAPSGRLLFDAALRSSLATSLAAASAAGGRVADYVAPGASKPAVPALLALACAAATARGVEVATPLAALEDAVEATPASQAADAAALVETVGASALAVAGWDKCKLPLLRVCAGLLARVPRRADGGPSAAARLHFFLASAAPPSDKSGLNLLGAANDGHPVTLEEATDGGDGDDGAKVDAQLYTSFWSLAPALQDPVTLLPPDAWPGFASRVRTVLAAFKATPVAVAAGGTSTTAPSDAATDALPPVGPFHLASPSLFPLQLRDGTARRVFLVAALAAVHAARHPPPKLAARRGVLRSKALADAAALEADLYSALAATPERGAAFAEAVRATLARETAWVEWKAAAPPCPPIDRAPRAPPRPPAPAGGQGAPPARPPRGGLGAPPPPTLGTPDLDRLWSVTPDNAVADLKSADRGVVPTLREFLRPVALEMDPEAGIEKPYKRQASAVYQWKALRRVARTDMAAFGASLAAGRDLEVALAALFPEDVPEGWAPPAPPPVKEKEGDGATRKRKAGDGDGGEDAEGKEGAGEAVAAATSEGVAAATSEGGAVAPAPLSPAKSGATGEEAAGAGGADVAMPSPEGDAGGEEAAAGSPGDSDGGEAVVEGE